MVLALRSVRLRVVKGTIAIRLAPSGVQGEKLAALQTAFVAACNAVAPRAFAYRCINRVRLHHLAYYGLRECFPVPVLTARVCAIGDGELAAQYRALPLNREIAEAVASCTWSPREAKAAPLVSA